MATVNIHFILQNLTWVCDLRFNTVVAWSLDYKLRILKFEWYNSIYKSLIEDGVSYSVVGGYHPCVTGWWSLSICHKTHGLDPVLTLFQPLGRKTRAGGDGLAHWCQRMGGVGLKCYESLPGAFNPKHRFNGVMWELTMFVERLPGIEHTTFAARKMDTGPYERTLLIKCSNPSTRQPTSKRINGLMWFCITYDCMAWRKKK